MEENEAPCLQEVYKTGKREKMFELSLSAWVTGLDAFQNKFREKTHLLSISAEEAIILMKSRVAVGSKVNLSLEIPKTLILENHLKLQISGQVIHTQENQGRNSKKRMVTVRLEKKFKLLRLPSQIN